MDYPIKYKSEVFTRDGHTFQLLIGEQGYTGEQITIGNLHGLSLEVQGVSESVDAPIIKTNLTWDVADEQGKGLVDGVRYGGWEDLYTTKATKYQVELLRDGRSAWIGFLTPDSWHDALQYNSYLGFTARDNIGSLQEFEYDDAPIPAENGLVSVADIVAAAFDRVPMKMDLAVYDTTRWMTVGENNAYNDFLVDTAAFAGMNWYDVLEKTLASFGLVLRYIGNSTFGLCPVRYLAEMMNGSTRSAALVNNSGSRDLDPAYKRIMETGTYQIPADDMPVFGLNDFTVDSSNRISIAKTGWVAAYSKSSLPSPAIPFTDELRAMMDESFGDIGEAGRSVLLKAVPESENKTGAMIRHQVRVANNTAVNVSAEFKHTFSRYADGTVIPIVPTIPAANIRIRVRYRWEQPNGLSWYYKENGWNVMSDAATQWSDEGITLLSNTDTKGNPIDMAFTLAAELTTPDTTGTLYIEFNTIYQGVTMSALGDIYVRMADFAATVNGANIPNGWKVNTIYDEDNNVTLKREALFGVCPSWVKSAGTIINGIYLRNAINGSTAAMNASWGRVGQAMPIPVLNALQYLAYHAKPNSVFTGELMDEEERFITFGECFTCYDRLCILVGGTLDLMTGRVQNAKLVEFDDYDDIWGGITDIDYKLITGGEGNYGNASVSGGAASGGSSSGGSAGGGWRPTQEQLDKWDKVGDLFDLDEDDNVFVKENRNLYSKGAIAGGGKIVKGEWKGGAHVLGDLEDVSLTAARAGNTLVLGSDGTWHAQDIELPQPTDGDIKNASKGFIVEKGKVAEWANSTFTRYINSSSYDCAWAMVPEGATHLTVVGATPTRFVFFSAYEASTSVFRYGNTSGNIYTNTKLVLINLSKSANPDGYGKMMVVFENDYAKRSLFGNSIRNVPTGKNYINTDDMLTGYTISSGQLVTQSGAVMTNKLFLRDGETYTIQGVGYYGTGNNIYEALYDADDNYLGRVGYTAENIVARRGQAIFTHDSSDGQVAYVRFVVSNTSTAAYAPDLVQLERGSEATEVEEYTGKEQFVQGEQGGGGAVTAERTLKVLSIGNSYSQDALAYVPWLMKSVAPDVKVTIGILYYSGCTLKQHYEFMRDNSGVYTYYKAVGTTWRTEQNNATIADALNNEAWDIILLQQGSTASFGNYDTQFAPYLNPLIGLIYGAIHYPVKVGWMLTQSRPKSGTSYEYDDAQILANYGRISANAQRVMAESICDFLIPVGTAVQNARGTSLNSIGDYGKLCSADGGHLQDGLPSQLAAYSCVLSFLELTGYGNRGIFAESTRCTEAWHSGKNIPGRHGTATGITEANMLLAQKCAIQAAKKPYEVTQIL